MRPKPYVSFVLNFKKSILKQKFENDISLHRFAVGQRTSSIAKARLEVYCFKPLKVEPTKQTVLSPKRNDISREFKAIIGEDVSSHLDKLKSEVHLIEDDIKQAVTEMSKLISVVYDKERLTDVGDRCW